MGSLEGQSLRQVIISFNYNQTTFLFTYQYNDYRCVPSGSRITMLLRMLQLIQAGVGVKAVRKMQTVL